jgi:hypothetical protein
MRDADGREYVGMEGFIMPLINAVKELSARVVELEKKIVKIKL